VAVLLPYAAVYGALTLALRIPTAREVLRAAWRLAAARSVP
jgi:hypothetical protein